MLLNRARADEIMDRRRLDGLIATFPINVYYCTDIWSPVMRIGRPLTHFAVLPRNHDAPAAFVGPANEATQLGESWAENIVLFSRLYKEAGVRDFDADIEEPPMAPGPTAPRGEPTEQERRWMAVRTTYGGRPEATPAEGLRAALREAGLERARVGADDPRVITWMNEMGLPDLKGSDAINAFREIRVVKSDQEIELMRTAARINEESLNAAVAACREGATQDEIQRLYMSEVALRGSYGVYLLSSSGFRRGVIHRNEVFMFDALSRYRNYHADLGRTVVVGQPSDEMLRRARAFRAGWEVAWEMVRPGTKAADITNKVLKAIQQNGFPEFNFVVLHSIGLEHTDHPLPMGADMPGSYPSLLLEENMVFNLDLPYGEIGWGSMHMEDTLRVTRDGFEPLTSNRTEIEVLA